MENYRNPGVAAVLSFFFTGLGQIYNGEIKKGIFLMSISTVSIASIIIGAVLIVNWLMSNFAYPIFMLVFGCVLVLVGIIIIMSVVFFFLASGF